jgi:uncharacterized protein YndB with AHSA1/START domain
VGAEGIHSACQQDRSPRGRRIPQLHAIPQGQNFWSKGVFREIVALERLVMTDSFADELGNTVPASHYGMSGDWPLEMLITVTLESREEGTLLTLKHSGLEGIDAQSRDDMREGWSQSFDKPAKYLSEILRRERISTGER